MLRTLKECRFALLQFFNDHALTGTVMYGGMKQYTVKADKTYIAVNIEYLQTQPSAKTGLKIFNITVADRISRDFNDEADIHERCEQILCDLYAFIGDTNVFTSSAIVPFTQADGDYTAGVVGGISIQTPLSINDCLTPKK